MTLDTSGLLAVMDVRAPYHASCRSFFDPDSGPYFISLAILSEIAHFMEARYSSDVEQAFLKDIMDGAYSLDWTLDDVDRMRELTQRYDDLGLGIADAAVIACAERHRGRVLTTDRRHFPVVARGEKTITVLPEFLER